MKVEITALADANLEEIYLRIREDSPSRAAKWRKGLLRAAETLDLFPERAMTAHHQIPRLTLSRTVDARRSFLRTTEIAILTNVAAGV